MTARRSRRKRTRKLTDIDEIPAFGKMPTAKDHGDMFAGFESYMLKCTHAEPEAPPYTVNILHMSPARAGHAAVRAAEIGRLSKFMSSEGFTVRLENGVAGWDLTDVAILEPTEYMRATRTTCLTFSAAGPA